MTFLSFSLAFSLLVVLQVVLDSKFKLCVFVLSMYSSRGRLRNQVVLGLICDEQLTCLGLNLNPEIFCDSTLLSVSCGEMCLLIS
jgi:hypothetical protein